MTEYPRSVLERITGVMNATFRIPPSYVVSRNTTSADVDGWDSLSHALFIMAVEREFSVEIPLDEAYTLADVGQLVDIVSRLSAERQGEP